MMENPLTCPLCGGNRPAYRSTRSVKWRTQYRRCSSCGETSKTTALLPLEPKRLTPNEVEQLRSLLPFSLPMVSQRESFDVFLVVRPR